MRNYFYIKLAIGHFLLILAPGLFGQDINQRINNKIDFNFDSLLIFQNKGSDYIDNFRYAAQYFCTYKHENVKKSSELLNFTFNSKIIIPKYIIHKFYIDISDCVDRSQKSLLAGNLENSLGSSDIYFHDLISIYKISSYLPFLKQNTSDSLFNELKKEIKLNKVKNWNIFQLRNLATLANLGDEKLEDYLINSILDLHDYILKNDIKKMYIFYGEILPNSVGLLYSKHSILKTMHFLDETEAPPTQGYHDVATISYSLEFFRFCIMNKLNSFDLEYLSLLDFEKNKEKIKTIIKTEDNIYKKHIRLDK